MTEIRITGLFLFLFSFVLSGCTWLDVEGLSVRPISHIVYACGQGEVIEASYYTLNDKSLEFVRLKMPNGKKRTLPRVLSASGVRYTDDVDFVWWTKGEYARVEIRVREGNWQVLYDNCRAVKPKL